MCRDVEQRSEHRRIMALVGVSLLVHAAALTYVARRPQPPAPPSNAMQLEAMAWVDVQPAPVEAVTPAPTPVPPPSATTKKQQQPTRTPTPSSPTIGGGTPGGENAPPSGVGTRGDLPLATRPSLVPSSGFTMQLGTGGLEPDSPRGTTIKNGPGEAPDQASLNDFTGEVLTRKLNTELQQEVGLAAVAVGNVPAHFKHYESAMRSALPKAKIDRTPPTTGDVVRDVAGMLFNEGPSAEASKKVADSPLGRSVANQNVMMPNVDDQRFRESAMQQMAAAESIRERISRARLRTVLEVTTDASGALADVSIVEKSGDARFDESVLHFSRKVARTIPDADDKMLGTSMWRTRWQFTWEPPDVRVRLLNAWRVPQ